MMVRKRERGEKKFDGWNRKEAVRGSMVKCETTKVVVGGSILGSEMGKEGLK